MWLQQALRAAQPSLLALSQLLEGLEGQARPTQAGGGCLCLALQQLPVQVQVEQQELELARGLEQQAQAGAAAVMQVLLDKPSLAATAADSAWARNLSPLVAVVAAVAVVAVVAVVQGGAACS